MPYTVSESVRARRRTATGAERVYVVRYTAPGTNNENNAYGAVLDWLGTQTENDPTVPLRYALFGVPLTGLDLQEIDETEGAAYEATARWGVVQAESGTGARNQPVPLTVLQAAMLTPTSATGTVQYEITASAKGGSIDFAPLAWVFGKETENLASSALTSGLWLEETAPGVTALRTGPQFDLRSIGVVHKEARKEETIVRGLDFSPPPADYNVEIAVAGSAVKSSWVAEIMQAADQGVINTDSMSIGGISFAAGTLLLVGASVAARENGTTAISLGLAYGSPTSLAITGSGAGQRVDLTPFGGGTQWRRFEFTGGANAPEQPENYTLVTTGLPSYTVSRFDYVDRFIFKKGELEGIGEETRLIVTEEPTIIKVHRIWGAASFATLFGGSIL